MYGYAIAAFVLSLVLTLLAWRIKAELRLTGNRAFHLPVESPGARHRSASAGADTRCEDR